MPIAPLVQLLVSQAPAILGAVGAILKQNAPAGTPPPTSADVIAAFEALFTQSVARDHFLIAVLQAEIDAAKPKNGIASASELGAHTGNPGE